MKKTKIAMTISILLSTTTAYAEEDSSFLGFSLSGSAALTSDYIWRGISQSHNGPAIQGSLDLTHESGFYLGAWGSNVDWDGGASLELDAYAGFTRDTKIGNFEFTYDIGWLHYDYPMDTGASNFNEIYFGLATSPIDNLNTSIYYFQDIGVENKFGIGYVDVAADYTLPDWAWNTVILGHYGFYANKDSSASYSDWKVGIAKEIAGLTFEFAYTDTNGDNNRSATGPQTNGDHYVFTVSRAFGDDTSPLTLIDGVEAGASVALTTDYIWRGVSQTGNAPAIQASFDVSHESGLYIGAWGSNIEFADSDRHSLELDVYAGFTRDIALGSMSLNYDIGFLHYDYPLATASSNFNEVYGGLTLTPIENLNTSFYYYHDVGVENKFGIGYLDLAVDYQLPDWAWNVTTSAHYGAYFKRDEADTYSDWKVAISKDISIVNVEVAYTDTSNNQYHGNGKNLSDARVVGTLSASF